MLFLCSPTLPFPYSPQCLLLPCPPSLFLASHQILKLYAWEPSFQSQVEGIRGKELKVMRKFAYLTSVSTFIFSCAPAVVSAVKEPRKKTNVASQRWSFFLSFFLTLSFFFAGISGHICSVCRGELREHVDC